MLLSIFSSRQLAETFTEANRQKNAEREELIVERNALEKEHEMLQKKIVNFLDNDSPEKPAAIESAKTVTKRLGEITEKLAGFNCKPIAREDIASAFENIGEFWEMLFPAEQYRILRLIVDSISVLEDSISLILKTHEMPGLVSELAGMDVSGRKDKKISASADAVSPEILQEGKVLLRVPASFKYKNGRKTIIVPETLEGENPDSPDKVQSPMVQAIANAHRWREKLESGEVGSIAELARNLGYSRPYATRILSLTNLSPEIVEAVIHGEEPNGLSLGKLVAGFSADWEEQKKIFGFKMRSGTAGLEVKRQ